MDLPLQQLSSLQWAGNMEWNSQQPSLLWPQTHADCSGGAAGTATAVRTWSADEPTSSDSNATMMAAQGSSNVWGMSQHPRLHPLLGHQQEQQQQLSCWQLAASSAAAHARGPAATMELPSMHDLLMADDCLQHQALSALLPATPVTTQVSAAPPNPKARVQLPDFEQPSFASHALADKAAEHQRWRQQHQLQLAEVAAAVNGICGGFMASLPAGPNSSSSSSNGALQQQHALGSYQQLQCPAAGLLDAVLDRPDVLAAPAAAQPDAPAAAKPRPPPLPPQQQQARRRGDTRAPSDNKADRCSSQDGSSEDSGGDHAAGSLVRARAPKRQRGRGRGASKAGAADDASMRNCLYQRARRQRQQQELQSLKQQVVSLTAAKAHNQERISELLTSHAELLGRMRELTSKWQSTVEKNQQLQQANLEAQQQICTLLQQKLCAGATAPAAGGRPH